MPNRRSKVSRQPTRGTRFPYSNTPNTVNAVPFMLDAHQADHRTPLHMLFSSAMNGAQFLHVLATSSAGRYFARVAATWLSPTECTIPSPGTFDNAEQPATIMIVPQNPGDGLEPDAPLASLSGGTAYGAWAPVRTDP